jgi:hypothetical protein
MKRSIFAFTVVAAMLLAPAPGKSQPMLVTRDFAPFQNAADCRGWSVVKSGDPSSNVHLYGVSGAANSLWAVGSYAQQVFRTLTEVWNGTSWSVVPSKNNGTGDNDLYGVAVVSPDDAWAVGEWNATPTSRPKPLIEHWDGSAWIIIPSPSAGQLSALGAVAAVSPDDVWAVGAFFNFAGNQQTLVEHWNGSKWSIVPSPSPGLSYNGLGHLLVVSPTDIWATGSWSGDGGNTSQTLIERWNGAHWSVVQSPNVFGSIYNSLGGIVASNPRDLWSVGSSESAPGYASRTLIVHWNGTRWSIVPSPNVGSAGNTLSDIALGAAPTLWAVGSYIDTSDFLSRTLIERWNGVTWRTFASPNPGPTEDALDAITATASGLWTVGDQANQQVGGSLVEFHC